MIRILSLLGLLALPAEAQVLTMRCAASDVIDGHLRHRFGESPVALGVTDGDALAAVVLYVSSEGSWTLVLVRPNGDLCMLASGQDWRQMPPGVDG